MKLTLKFKKAVAQRCLTAGYSSVYKYGINAYQREHRFIELDRVMGDAVRYLCYHNQSPFNNERPWGSWSGESKWWFSSEKRFENEALWYLSELIIPSLEHGDPNAQTLGKDHNFRISWCRPVRTWITFSPNDSRNIRVMKCLKLGYVAHEFSGKSAREICQLIDDVEVYELGTLDWDYAKELQRAGECLELEVHHDTNP